jgi:hypothetical protein
MKCCRLRNYGNPLDVTAGFSLDSLPIATKALIDDPNVGMLFISFPMSNAAVPKAFNKGMADSPKPKVMVALGDTWQLAPDIAQAVAESPAVFSRSSDRMLRAITLYTRYGRLPPAAASPRSRAISRMPARQGAQPEWWARNPGGRHSRSMASLPARWTTPSRPPSASAVGCIEGARRRPTRPKPQVPSISDAAALRAPGRATNIKARRGRTLDGCLIERCRPEARIDDWRQTRSAGAVCCSLGSIWSGARRRAALPSTPTRRRSRGPAQAGTAKLLTAFRGAPPVDVEAVAKAVLAIGRLMRTTPGIVEIDVNPLMVHAKGQGATALDALIVAREVRSAGRSPPCSDRRALQGGKGRAQ